MLIETPLIFRKLPYNIHLYMPAGWTPGDVAPKLSGLANSLATHYNTTPFDAIDVEAPVRVVLVLSDVCLHIRPVGSEY